MRINYFFIRILKFIFVEVYCIYIVVCIFYYLVIIFFVENEGYIWIGSLKLGDYSYENFWKIDIWKCYIIFFYFVIVIMVIVGKIKVEILIYDDYLIIYEKRKNWWVFFDFMLGYGDIYVVNLREMIFVMIYVLFDMVFGVYFIGNIIVLIVKGLNIERFRDKMNDLVSFMNWKKLRGDICS